MKLRIAITLIALILYVGLFDVYVFWILDWGLYFGKVFYNVLTGLTLAFALGDLKSGFINEHHRRFNLIIFGSILVNYLFIILTITEFFNYEHPQPMFYAYDGSVLVITLTIFYNENKYQIMVD